MTDLNPIAVIDVKESEFQKDLDNKAGVLCDEILLKGLGSSDIKEKALAINTYTKYKDSVQDDVSFVMSKLSSLSERQLKVLEVSLKKQKLLEDFKGGKMSLQEVYQLEGLKKKKRK